MRDAQSRWPDRQCLGADLPPEFLSALDGLICGAGEREKEVKIGLDLVEVVSGGNGGDYGNAGERRINHAYT